MVCIAPATLPEPYITHRRSQPSRSHNIKHDNNDRHSNWPLPKLYPRLIHVHGNVEILLRKSNNPSSQKLTIRKIGKPVESNAIFVNFLNPYGWEKFRQQKAIEMSNDAEEDTAAPAGSVRREELSR